MSYATRADLEARFGADEALDLSGTGDERIEAALADASAEIDAALAAAYRLPLGGAEKSPGTGAEKSPGTGAEKSPGTGAEKSPGTGAENNWPRLVAIACDLARARLYDDVSSAEVSARAEQARTALTRLADGEEALLDAAGGPAARRDRATRKGPAPSMTPDNLAGL